MKHATLAIALVGFGCLLAGCDRITFGGPNEESVRAPKPRDPGGTISHPEKARADPGPSDVSDEAVDKALAYAEKYMTEAEENKKLRRQIRALEKENQALKRAKETLGAELTAAVKELGNEDSNLD